MLPAVPDEPFQDASGMTAEEIGQFDQGSPLSRWALSRYLVGRAIGESVGHTLLAAALLIFGLAAVCEWVLHSTFLAIVFGLLAALVLLLRTALRAVLRRLTAADRYGPLEARLRALVSDTRGDVRRELRRVGLPSRAVTLPLLAFRLTGKRRPATLAKLRQFDVDRAVPRGRLDELHMLLRTGLGGR